MRKTYHRRALKNHVNTQHSKEKEVKNILSSVSGNITSNNFLHGTCVDHRCGVFFVHNTFCGPDFPIHVLYSLASVPPVMTCSVSECNSIQMTAWLSEDVVYLCDHIKSIQYISGESPVVPHLSHSSLDYAVNTLHILRSSRIGGSLLMLAVLLIIVIFQCTPMSVVNTGRFVNAWLSPMTL